MGVIMDLKGRKSSREDDRSGGGVSGEVEDKKACTDCKTTKTPLWRGGPAGPKSLCNACGIRYRKKRTMMRLEKGPEKKREKTTSSNTTSGSGLNSESLRMSVMVLGEEMMLQRPPVVKKKRCRRKRKLREEELMLQRPPVVMLQRPPVVKKKRSRRKRKLREEEQAAFSLMALSCGSVFA